MRADRLLSILLLLQVNRRMTAGDLAQRLEVSTRTIHRDMEALCAAGVPLYAERGRDGGWVLPEPFRTNLTGLTESEIQTLFLSTPPSLLADLGLQQASEAALIKLFATLPLAQRRGAEHAQQRIHVDPSGWNRPEESVPALAALQEAVWQDRRVYLVYERSDGTTVDRLVEPLGLVAKGSLWYLVARDDGKPRTYRVARVRSARVSEDSFTRPADFDLAEFWKRASAEFVANLPRYPVLLRIPEEELRGIFSTGGRVRVEDVSPADANGRVTLQLRFDTVNEAAGCVLSFGPNAEIIEPEELRTRVIRLAQRVLVAYGVSEDRDRQLVDRSTSAEARPADVSRLPQAT
jgi:predicted DNA-binding transcriptional regulator YafY